MLRSLPPGTVLYASAGAFGTLVDREILGGDWSGEEVALTEVAMKRQKILELDMVLDAFGHDVHPQTAAHRDHRGSNGMAALWVISGVIPSVELVTAVFHPAAPTKTFGERIELAVDLATPPEEVLLAYKKARTAVAGGRVRMPTPKHLRLAVFADQKPAGEKWVEAMGRWNDAYPVWRYEYVPNFWRGLRSRSEALLEGPSVREE